MGQFSRSSKSLHKLEAFSHGESDHSTGDGSITESMHQNPTDVINLQQYNARIYQAKVKFLQHPSNCIFNMVLIVSH